MGFMDKAKQLGEQAKQLGEQAQQKIDEAQQKQQGGQQAQQGQPAVRYDKHGRPIPEEQEGPPAGEAPPPSGEPAAAPPEPQAADPAPPPPPPPAPPCRGRREQQPGPFQADRMTISGVLTAMVTPFDANGDLNEEAAAGLMRHLLENGSDGLVLAGSTGEAAMLTDEEMGRLWRLGASECG